MWGHQVGREQVARLMAIAGVHGVGRGQHNTTTTHGGSVEGHFGRRTWSGGSGPRRPTGSAVRRGFSHVWTHVGFCYISFVVDVYSRRILGWRVSMSKTTALVMSAVEQALFTRN